MTAFDDALAELATGIDTLPRRWTAALFQACANGLLPGFRQWAAHTGHDGEELSQRALATARTYALTGQVPSDAAETLAAVSEATPDGESPDEVSATAAQDYWICADISVRVIAEPDYEPGSGIEYALEPVIQHATERLYGVTQLGSGPDEDAQVAAVLREPDVAAALDFCAWAVDFLSQSDTLTEAELAELENRSAVLTP